MPFLNILDVLGYVATTIVIVETCVLIYWWVCGILPVILRLGNGLAHRKIAIFAKGDSLTSLQSLLKDSALFDHSPKVTVSGEHDLGIAETATIFLVYWPDWSENLEEILQKKSDRVAMIIYAPRDQGDIPPGIMAKLTAHRNLTVTNLRGRLLNDMVLCMITTSYEKRTN